MALYKKVIESEIEHAKKEIDLSMDKLRADIEEKYKDFKDNLLVSFLTALYDGDTQSLLRDMTKMLAFPKEKVPDAQERTDLLRCLWSAMEVFYDGGFPAIFSRLQNGCNEKEMTDDDSPFMSL